jgi:hypothetical protein
MQRSIKSKNTEKVYASSRETWLAARDVYLQTKRLRRADFSYIMKAEPNMRDNLLNMLYEKAAAYGNTEVFRVKSSSDTVGPLNIRFNVCGAALRDFAMTMYPFPDPAFFGTRMHHHDSKRKTFRIMGYEADSYGPRTPLIHPDMVPMDFVDAIRHHLDYLATYCYIYDVPPRDTGRYWKLLQLRARAYLDYIYSEHLYGKRAFRVGTNTILQTLKMDIQEHYSIRTGNAPTVTGSIELRKPSFSMAFFESQIAEAKAIGIEHPSLNELERILQGGYRIGEHEEEPCLTENDVRHIWRAALRRSRRIGSQVHRHISDQLCSPWSLAEAIRNGDSLGSNDGYLLCSEVSVNTDLGEGRVDIVLLRREVTPDGLRVYWKPIMVLEIKTRLSQFWELTHETIRSISRKSHGLLDRKVGGFSFRSRVLDIEEWDAIVRATPNKGTIKQVMAYTDAVWGEYQRITGTSQDNPILVGTLLLDATENIGLARKAIRSLVIKAYETMMNKRGSITRTLIEPILNDELPRIAVVIHERDETSESEGTFITPSWRAVYDPLESASSTGRRFILALFSKSRTSAGFSAGWISQYYHGLHLVRDLLEDYSDSSVIWLDLADEFSHPQLAEARLRLRPYSYQEKDVLRSQPKYIRELFESIRVVGLLRETDDFLFNKGQLPNLRQHLIDIVNGKKLIIVSGWSTLQEATPEPYRARLNELLNGIITQLPNDRSTTVLWFDAPVPGETSSAAYSSRTLLPFYDSSRLRGEVNEIIWNLPVAPKSEVLPQEWWLPVLAATPFHDDIRAIITQNTEGFDIRLTLIPSLTNWSRRFRNEGFGVVTKAESTEEVVPDSTTRERMKVLALTLLPWLVELWPSVRLDTDLGSRTVRELLGEIESEYEHGSESVSAKARTLEGPFGKEPSILQRLRYRPKTSRSGKALVATSVNTINSRRLYRGPRQLKTNPWHLTQVTSQRASVNLHAKDFDPDVWFGLRLSSEELGFDWIAIQDAKAPYGMRFGFFRQREEGTESENLDWSITRLDVVRDYGSKLDEFDRVTEYMFTRVHQAKSVEDSNQEPKWLAWGRPDTESDWVLVGTLSHVLRPRSATVSLRAFTIKSEGASTAATPPMVDFPENLTGAARQAIAQVVRRLLRVRYVKVSLDMEGDACEVRFADEGDRILRRVKIRTTVDVIQLLRWPMTEGRPLRLGHNLRVTWNPFHDFSQVCPDIDYGELRYLEPFVILNRSDDQTGILPPFISDALAEHRPVSVVILHDAAVCPLTDFSEWEHGNCWGIRTTDEESGLEDKSEDALSDRRVYDFVKKLAQTVGEKRVQIEFDHGQDENDRLVFHESELMRKLSKEFRHIPLHPLAPGHTAKIKLMLRQRSRARKQR